MKQHQPIDTNGDCFPDSAADDVRRGVLSGQQEVVEELLTRYPAAAEDVEQALDLIYAEMAAQEEAGKTPLLNEYTARFPQWADRIERLFEVHEAFRETEAAMDTDLPDPDSTFPGDDVSLSATSPSIPLNDSRKIGQYELLNEIGSGATGIVFRARQAGLSRMVAVKILRPFGTDESRERFAAEAEMTARLQHPNIVRVHEVGNDAGCDYMSMELLDGGSLATALGHTAYSPQAAADLVRTLATAVSAAHEQGIVHRDLKPGNVLMANDGSPRISDFGLARHLSEAAVRQTRTGAILGTPGYMAPEQAHGSLGAGPAADIYSLGAILYELLTGRPPYHGTSVVEILEQMHVTDPPRVRQLRPGVPRDLQTICMKCLERNPDERYASAADLRDDLTRYLDGLPIHARPISLAERTARWALRHKGIAALSLLLIMTAIVGAAGIIWQWRRAEDGLSQAQVAAHVAKAAEREQQRQRLMSEQRLYRQQIMTADRELQFGLSTIGEKLLDDCDPARRGWEWDYLNASARASKTVLDGLGPYPSALACSADGRLVAVTVGHHADAVNRQTLVKDLESGSLLWKYSKHNMGLSLDFSPDSQQLAIAGHGHATLHDAHSGEILRRFPMRGRISSWGVAFSPDGSELAIADGHTVRMFNVADEQVAATVCQGLEDSHGAYAVDYHPTLPLIAVATRRMGVTVHDTISGEAIEHLPMPADTRSVQFSPDGRMLVAAGYSQHDQGCLRVWHCADRVFEFQNERYDRDGSRTTAEFSSDSQTIAVWGGSTALKLLSSKDLRTCAIYPAHSYTRNMKFTEDSRCFFTCGSDGRVRMWDRGREFRRYLVRQDVALASDFAMHPDGNTVAMVADVNPSRGHSSYNNTIEVFDLNRWRRTQRLWGHSAGVTCVDYDPTGRWLASGSLDRTIRIWPVDDDRAAHVIDSLNASVAGLHFMRPPDVSVPAKAASSERHATSSGCTLLSVLTTGDVHLHDVGEMLSQDTSSPNAESLPNQTLLVSTGAANVVHTDLRKSLLALCTRNGRVLIVDTSTRNIATLCDGIGPVHCVAFNNAADQISVACDDGTVRLWKVSEGEPFNAQHIWTAAVHDGPVTSVGFHPDGKRIVSASEDGLVQILSVESGSRMMSLKSHSYPGPVARAAFGSNGRCVVATVRNRLYMWDATLVVPILAEDMAEDENARAAVADWHRDQAEESYRDENWFGAAFHWDFVARLDSTDVLCHVWTAETLEQQQDWSAAESSYFTAISVADTCGTFLSPDRGRACYGLAQLLATCPDVSKRRGAAAIWYSLNALATHPRMLPYWKALWSGVVECNRRKR